jgi:hydroxymethylbilane synthase
VRLGTRGSALALAQARLVEAALGAAGLEHVELVTIETEGDRRRPDTAWGEGAFVAAIERALLDGRVDAAIHSAKDVPTSETPGLVIAAYLRREDARDALVVRTGEAAHTLSALPPGARVGTDSPRRTGFLLASRADLRVHPLHGNVDTRLRRLDAGETDALVLAVAGLVRLGRADRISEILEPSLVPPAPGQGAIAVQVRAADAATSRAVAAIDDRPTRLAVEAERAFLTASGGGCRAPIGALAQVDGDQMDLLGAWASPDGSASASAQGRGSAEDGVRLGRELAARLAGQRRSGGRRVLVTRATEQVDELARELQEVGVAAVSVPAIAIEAAPPGGALDAAVRDLDRTAWVVVTSANGARALLSAAGRVDAPLDAPRWAAVGSATRRVLERGGVEVDHQPQRSSAAGIGEELPVRAGERVLLVRGDLADEGLPDALRARGAEVDTVVAYRTREAPVSSRPLLRRALDDGPLDAVLFTSGSTVRGLVALAEDESLPEVTSIPAICIGPETAAEARRAGFHVLAEAAMRDAAALATTTVAALATELQEIR